MSSKRAVVVLGRLPVAGRVKTRLTKAVTPAQAALLYRAFLLDVFDVVSKAQAKLTFTATFSCALSEGETIDQAQALTPKGWGALAQCDGDLGARIAQAQAEAHKGAEHVLILGSDAPHMDPERIVEAFSALESHDAVCGPTSDGGYDLIGLAGPQPALLTGIPWSTEEVMDATRRAAQASGLTIAELSEGYDLDHPDDLDRLLLDGAYAPRSREAIGSVRASLDSTALPG